jgi:hypothetical protein
MTEVFESKFVWELLIRLGLLEEAIDRSGQMPYFLAEASLQEIEFGLNLLGPVVMV